MPVRGSRVALKKEAGRLETPPESFRIWPFGDVETSKGTFIFDDVSATLVMEDFAAQGNKLMIDYEHAAAALQEDPAAMKGGAAPAAGWFDLEVRDDGLYAVNVEWTESAAAMLVADEYRYFSPYFAFDRGTKRIIALFNIGLVNIPATTNMESLMAASKTFHDHRSGVGEEIASMLSFDAIEDAVRSALSKQMNDYDYAWICDLYDDSVVYGMRNKLYRAAYTIEGAAVMLAAMPHEEVLRSYVPVSEITASTTDAAALAKVAGVETEGLTPDEIQSRLEDVLTAGRGLLAATDASTSDVALARLAARSEPEPTPEPEFDEATLPEPVRAQLAKGREASAALAAKEREIEAERARTKLEERIRVATSRAKADFACLPADSAALGRLLVDAEDRLSPESRSVLTASLSRAAAAVKASGVLGEAGKDAGQTALDDGAGAKAKLGRIAKDLQAKDPTLTDEQAFTRAMDSAPHLYREYADEKRTRPTA